MLTNHGKSLTRPLTNHRVCLRTCPKRLYSQQNLSIYTALKWLHVEIWATIKYMISLLTWRYTLHMAISSFRQHMTLTLPNTWSVYRCFGWAEVEDMAIYTRTRCDTCCIVSCDLKAHADPNIPFHRFSAIDGAWVINKQRKTICTLGNKQDW